MSGASFRVGTIEVDLVSDGEFHYPVEDSFVGASDEELERANGTSGARRRTSPRSRGSSRSLPGCTPALREAGVVEAVEGEVEILPGVSLVPAPGPTVGHVVVSLGGPPGLALTRVKIHPVGVTMPALRGGARRPRPGGAGEGPGPRLPVTPRSDRGPALPAPRPPEGKGEPPHA